MKIVDLDVANAIYDDENNIPIEIAKLNNPQKYIILDTGECWDLEIETVTDTAIYVKIADYEVKGDYFDRLQRR